MTKALKFTKKNGEFYYSVPQAPGAGEVGCDA